PRPSVAACPCSSVAQWQSIRLLTGGLLVRVQPEEPLLFENLSTRPRPAPSSEVLRLTCSAGCIGTRLLRQAVLCSVCCATWRGSIRCCMGRTFRTCAETSQSGPNNRSYRVLH